MSLKDEVACVVDQHTGRVLAQFNSPFAKEEAKGHLSDCRRIKEYQAGVVLEGEAAVKAVKKGRV